MKKTTIIAGLLVIALNPSVKAQLRITRATATTFPSSSTVEAKNPGASNNVIIGDNGSIAIPAGGNNTFVGNDVGPNNSGSQNTFIGQGTGYYNVTGAANTFLGAWTGSRNTSGGANTFVGNYCGASNNTGSGNTFVGQNSGEKNTSAGGNSFFGKDAGLNSEGVNNTFIGYEAGSKNSTGTRNVALGVGAGPVGTFVLNNTIAIGYDAKVNASNSMILGGTGVNAVKVGIGTVAPTSNLHMESSGGEEILLNSTSNLLQSVVNLRTGSSVQNDLKISLYGTGASTVLLPVGTGVSAAVTNANMGLMTTKSSPMMIGLEPVVQGVNASQNIHFVNNIPDPVNPNTFTAWECMRINQTNGFVGVHTRTALTGTGSGAPQALFHVNLTNPARTINAATQGIRFEGLPVAPHPDVIVIDSNGNLAKRAYPIGLGSGWSLSGNTTGGSEFIGTLSNDDFRFTTNSTQRGKVTADGNWDFGNTNTFTSSLVSGAFGETNIIATSSDVFVTGKNNTVGASSDYSTAHGNGNTINASAASFSSGTANTISGSSGSSAAIGATNSIDGSESAFSAGSQNKIINNSPQSGAMGYLNTVDNAAGSFAIGKNNTIKNNTINQGCVALGMGNLIENSEESVAAGEGNTMKGGHGCFIGGGHNNTTGRYNIAIGNTLTTKGLDVHAYGNFIDNNLPESIVMGFRNNRTMVVSQRGIAIQMDASVSGFPFTYTPTRNLEVNASPAGSGIPSNIAFHNLPKAPTGYPAVLVNPVSGDLFMSNGNYSIVAPEPPTGSLIIGEQGMSKNVSMISNALGLIDQIQPKKYQLDDTKYPTLNLSSDKEIYGIVAQDLEKVLPGLVQDIPVPNSTSSETVKGINYSELVPILIQAVKEQQVQLKDQQNKIEQLMAMVTKEQELKADLRQSIAKISIELSDNDLIVLNQNIPNPSDQYTSIGFNIPASVQSAVIRFVSLEGKVIKSMVIAERGKGVLNVYTSELSQGVYTYSLLVDGKLADTKKMEVNR